jgi:hypothetical protein
MSKKQESVEIGRESAARAIGTATTLAELRAAYRAYIGRRQKFCVLSPEYAGCCNSGARIKIWSGSSGLGTYYVGPEYRFWDSNNPMCSFSGPTARKDAINEFTKRCMKIVRFNVKVLSEAAEAREKGIEARKAGNLSDMVEAMLVLSDTGL